MTNGKGMSACVSDFNFPCPPPVLLDISVFLAEKMLVANLPHCAVAKCVWSACLQEMGFYCPKRLRRLRLQQYSMTERQRRDLDAQLTHNKFRKAAWKLWHHSNPAAASTDKVDCFFDENCVVEWEITVIELCVVLVSCFSVLGNTLRANQKV